MATITQLAVQKKNRERISVFVDDVFFCGLSVDDTLKNNLVVGLEMTEEELSHLLSLAGENDMYNKALVYILRSPRTENEVRRYLSRKECSAEMTARIIERLKTMNFINDEAYAKMFAAQKHVKISVRAIKHRLRARGVAPELAEEATQEVDVEEQGELARTVAEKYMRYKEYNEKSLQSLYRYLVAKGFDYDDVSEIVSDYRKKREIDPEVKAEYKSYYDDYRQSRKRLTEAKRDARVKKKRLKELKKRLLKEL